MQCAKYGNMIKHDKARTLNAANYMSFAPSLVSKLPSAKVPCFAAKKRKKSRHILRPNGDLKFLFPKSQARALSAFNMIPASLLLWKILKFFGKRIKSSQCDEFS